MWEVLPPADVFRIFERGGRNINNHVPGDRPARRARPIAAPGGAGTARHPPVEPRARHRRAHRDAGLNLHKTRLNDPLAGFMGTNDQPGDYRASGCAACHVIYATTAIRAIPDPMRAKAMTAPR